MSLFVRNLSAFSRSGKSELFYRVRYAVRIIGQADKIRRVKQNLFGIRHSHADTGEAYNIKIVFTVAARHRPGEWNMKGFA